MLPRHHQIIQYIEQFYEANVCELAEQFSVSVETIRRDLNKLAKQNLLHRTHGGAVSTKNRDIGRTFHQRQRINNDAKRLIAEKVARKIPAGALIALDASSTSLQVALHLPNIPCKVLTSSMRIIYALSHKPHIETIATGGIYSEKYDAFYGPLSESLLSRLKIDIAILSCTGISDQVIWESNEINVAFKRKLLSSSQQTFLLADHSKFERKDLMKMADLSLVNKLFTNQIPSPSTVQYCKEHQIELIY